MWHLSASRNASSATTKTETTTTTSSPPSSKACVAQTLTQQSTTLQKMLYAGEDVKFIARRIMILASEDIGNADPQALCGSSRRSPGSRTRRNARVPDHPLPGSHLHGLRPQKQLRSQRHLRCHGLRQTHKNHSPATPPGRPLRRPRKLGHGIGYKYAHDYPNHYVHQQYLPTEIQGEHFYELSEMGYEKNLKRIPNQNQITVLIQKRAVSKERLPFSSFNSHNVHLRQNRIHTFLKSKLSCIQTQIIIPSHHSSPHRQICDNNPAFSYHPYEETSQSPHHCR